MVWQNIGSSYVQKHLFRATDAWQIISTFLYIILNHIFLEIKTIVIGCSLWLPASVSFIVDADSIFSVAHMLQETWTSIAPQSQRTWCWRECTSYQRLDKRSLKGVYPPASNKASKPIWLICNWYQLQYCDAWQSSKPFTDYQLNQDRAQLIFYELL